MPNHLLRLMAEAVVTVIMIFWIWQNYLHKNSLKKKKGTPDFFTPESS
jgi:hypothetical protein